MLQPLVKKYGVAVFSSNYTLYGDLSDRVMKTLQTFVPNMELYSIDEAFLDMHNMQYGNLLTLGENIRNTIKQNIGIPVTVGIASTKTLAKMANRFAKKKKLPSCVYYAGDNHLIKEMLAFTKVNDIWGIGKQYATFLNKNGFTTALDLLAAPEEWIRKNMTVVVQRLFNELKGIPAIQWEIEVPKKKNICTSRSFGVLQTHKEDIKEALCNYAAACALKLRNQKSCCKSLHVFIQTNPFRKDDKQYATSINIDLETPSNFTGEIIKYALTGLDIIFKEGYNYLKCGVIVTDLVSEDTVQKSMFDTCDRNKNNTAMQTMDRINKSLGKETVRLSVQGFEKRYRLRAEHLSGCYTTDINQILKISI
jgi:DNA polymerase V